MSLESNISTGAALFVLSVISGYIRRSYKDSQFIWQSISYSHMRGLLIHLRLDKTLELYRQHSSDNGNKGIPCKLTVVNELGYPFYISWIGENAKLHHFRRVNDNSIPDGSVHNYHTENTYTHHMFVCIRGRQGYPTYLNEISEEDFICSCMPRTGRCHHTFRIEVADYALPGEISVSHECACINPSDDIPLTAPKDYVEIFVSGFTVYFERSVCCTTPKFIPFFEQDLKAVCRLVPANSLWKIQESTPIYVNSSITYGTQGNPVIGRGMHYHPAEGALWLRCNGLNVLKAGCVEVNVAEDYLASRGFWGEGGAILHELCHAYHDKHCPGGYGCVDVIEAFERAMATGVYDCVPVHGPQGDNGPVKSYACANCMEFFAELSVAYMCDDSSLEFNKWFPHNRQQLKDMDPRSFDVLDRLWHAEW